MSVPTKLADGEDHHVTELLVPDEADIGLMLKLSRGFGDVGFLCATIDSDLPLTREDRKLLAVFLWNEMDLRRPPGNTRIMRRMNPRPRSVLLNAATSEFRNLRNAAKKMGKSYRTRDDLVKGLAAKYSLTYDTLDNHIRRSRRRKRTNARLNP
jgi:hypothetical protein